MSNEPYDRIVNPNDRALFVGDFVPNHKICFYKNEEQMGVLDFSGPEMTFTGKADESAKAFFDDIADGFKWRLADMEALRKQNATLLAIQAELVEALELALHSHDVILTSDPPQEAWKFRGVEAKARAALAKVEKSK